LLAQAPAEPEANILDFLATTPYVREENAASAAAVSLIFISMSTF
jgi:hypothetical protein